MKVLHIATSPHGGAGKAAVRLHEALIKGGVDSKMLVLCHSSGIPSCFTYKPQSFKENILNKFKYLKRLSFFLPGLKFRRVINSLPQSYEIATYHKTHYDVTKHPLYLNADIINLHWIADFIDYPSAFQKNIKPVVWTLHDMNPFSGIFHYDEDESRKHNSIRCLDNSVKQEKERILKKSKNLEVVCPSEWLLKHAKASQAMRHCDMKLIYNSVDNTVFKLLPKEFSRDLFNLPHDKKIILFVADNISNPRKGMDLLLESLKYITSEISDFLCVAVGKDHNFLLRNSRLLSLGSVSDERLMAVLYNCADIFVLPSRQDNLPNTMLESLNCGTPVVGFPIGGLLDIIQTGTNGVFAREISAKSLAKAIIVGLNEINFNRRNIRNMAVSRFDPSIQANKYLNVYEHLLVS